MVIDWLIHYFPYLVVLLLGAGALKLFFSIPFYKKDDGIIGIVLLLFKWYTEADFHVKDARWQMRNMRLLNLVSAVFYPLLLLAIMVQGAIKLFKH